MTLSRDIDGGWAWVVLGASYVNILLCSGLAYAAGIFQVVFLSQFEGSVAFTAWVTSLFSSLMQLAGPLSSLIANRYNCRVSVMVGGVCMTTGLFISGLADSLELLFVTFGLVAGVGMGLVYTTSTVIISFYFDKRRTLVNGIGASAGGLGIFMAPQISHILLEYFSWREALFVFAGISAQICVMGALMYSIHEKRRSDDDKIKNCCSLIFPCLKKLESVRGEKGHDEKCNDFTLVNYGSLEMDDDIITEERETNSNLPVAESRDGKPLQCSQNVTKAEQGGIDHSKSHLDISGARRCSEDLDCEHYNCHRNGTISDCCQNGDDNETSASQELLSQSSPKYQMIEADNNKSSVNDPNAFTNTTTSNSTNTTTTNYTNTADTSHGTSQKSDENKLKLIQNTNTTSEEHSSVELEVAKSSSDDMKIINDIMAKRPLYRNQFLWVLCICMFVSIAGCGTFNIHVPSFLKSQGLTEQQVTNALSINGLAILIGRCLIGALANSVQCDLLFFMIMHIIGGLIVCLLPVVGTSYLGSMCVMFGIGSYAGTLYAVLPTLTIRYVGLDKLTTAFGLEMVVSGLGGLVSPPLAGSLVDLTGRFEYNIFIGGALFILAGLVLMVLPGMEKNARTAAAVKQDS